MVGQSIWIMWEWEKIVCVFVCWLKTINIPNRFFFNLSRFWFPCWDWCGLSYCCEVLLNHLRKNVVFFISIRECTWNGLFLPHFFEIILSQSRLTENHSTGLWGTKVSWIYNEINFDCEEWKKLLKFSFIDFYLSKNRKMIKPEKYSL